MIIINKVILMLIKPHTNPEISMDIELKFTSFIVFVYIVTKYSNQPKPIKLISCPKYTRISTCSFCIMPFLWL